MLRASATAIVDAMLVDTPPASIQDYEIVRAATPAQIAALDRDSRRLVESARLTTFSRFGHVSDAKATAERLETDLRLAANGPLTARSAIPVLSALAEAYLAAGNPSESLRHSSALAQLDLSAEPKWRYRTLGLLAAAAALNGDHNEAEAALEGMTALIAEQGWDPDCADYMGGVAEGILALMSMDAERAARVARRLRVLSRLEPITVSLADVMESLSWALNGDPYTAMAIATRVAQGISLPNGPRLVTQYSRLLQAFILLRMGEPLRTLSVLEGMESGEFHLICPGSLRAVAHITVGDYRAALRDTGDCVKRRLEHNLWLLPLVLLCRAIAHVRLGNTLAGLREAAAAAAYGRRADLSVMFSFLPGNEVAELLDAIDATMPDVVDTAQLRLTLARSGGAQSPYGSFPRLSEREKVVAHYLRTELSFPSIAQELFVSPSTVKSQALAVYRKLGVDGRDEAVAALEAAGFYET
jgi:DNA-binding CsgD family transcriptional regulator